VTMRSKTVTLAWSIDSPIHMGEMKARLDAAFPEPWTWGDSYYFGEYLGGRLTRDAIGRIYEADGRFVVELHFYSDSADADALFAVAKDLLEHKVLSVVEARDTHVTSPMG
jgi:hypothetical protein